MKKWSHPLTWLDAFPSLFDNSLGHGIGRSRSVTGLFSPLAGSSFTEARPDAPVSPAVPIPRASEAHPETLWQTAGLQQLPTARSRRWVRLGQKGLWGPQCPACGRAPGVQPSCAEDSVQLSVQFRHSPQGIDVGGTEALFHSGAGKPSTSTSIEPPWPIGAMRNHTPAYSSVHSMHECVAWVCVGGWVVVVVFILTEACQSPAVSSPQEAKREFPSSVACSTLVLGDSFSNVKPLSALLHLLVGSMSFHLPDAMLKLVDLYFAFTFHSTVFKC